MKKNGKLGGQSTKIPPILKTLIIMKLSIILVSFVSLSFSFASTYAQETKLSLHISNGNLKEIFKNIESQSEFSFMYDNTMINVEKKVSIQAKDQTIKEVLDQVLDKKEVQYQIIDRHIVVLPAREKQQERAITGQVTDENQSGLPGVNVIVKGTAQGTVTDVEGNYKLEVPDENTILVYSSVGYTKEEITVGAKTVIDISLVPDITSLDEVVVIGYGTQKKKDLTGAVGVVDGEEIAARKVTNVSNALQGAVAGVSVTRSSSAPGSESTVRIRGISTLQGSNNPLILVDGVPVGSMDDVPPEDVESISVLKDGASAAIYGSRAAAGVIIITTKRAKSGEFKVSYSGEFISNVPTQTRRAVGAIRYMELSNEKQWNDNGNDANEFAQYSEDLITNYGTNNASDPDQFPDTNWRDLILKNSSTGHRHNLVLSGGSEKLKTIASFGYEYQDALYDHRDWRRFTARINNDLKISDKFGAKFDLAFKLTQDDQPSLDPTLKAIGYAPIYAALWQDGRISEGKQGDNVYAQLQHGGSKNNESYLLYGKLGVYYKPIEGMKISLNVAPNVNFQKYKSFNTSIPTWAFDDPTESGDPFYINGHNPSNRTLNERRTNNNSLTTQAMVNYDNSFGSHNLSAVLGYEGFSSENESLRVRGTEFTSNDYPFLNQAPVDKVFDAGTRISEVAYESYFGRIAYNYKDKYYLQSTVRRDGSSRFGPDYRWGTFPSVSAGWIMSNEDFMQSLGPVSFLKLRASYGQLGNDRLGNYLYLSVLQFSNALIANGSNVEAVRAAAQQFLTVEDITWETTATLDFGFDLSMFENQLSFTFDYFEKETTDMLLGLSIPSLSGFPDPTVNVGSMNTTGWELSTTWRDNIGDLKYSASFNLFDSKSIIGDVNNKRIFSGNTLSEEGIEFQSWYGYQSDGIFQTQEEVDNSALTSSSVGPGDIKYKDISGPEDVPDGVINELDKVVLGGSLPRLQYGGNIRLEYKGFDLGMAFQGIGKRDYYLNSTYTRPFQYQWFSPPQLLEGDYWSLYNTTEQNAVARYPRYSDKAAGNNYRFSDYWLVDGSYFRVKNITLGYTLPANIIQGTGLSSLRLYVAGNDLFTVSSLPEGIDPEGGTAYPVTKSFIIGVKVSF
jgi:TonB-linked SusC/RagA family outer membrane protein